MKIAYLVNQYPKTSHSFIRREIAALEEHGQPIERITIRRATDLADPGDAAEAERTWVLLDGGAGRLIRCSLGELLTQPRRWFKALRTAWRFGGRSDRGRLRHLAYLAEACVLVQRARAAGYDHLHSHFGTNSTTVAMLTRMLGGPEYSFTVHGPEEFDKPEGLSLGEKIARARFVVAISQFTRSQLFRWCELRDWSKLHVVHCGLDAMFLQAPATPIPDTNQLVCIGRLCEQKGQLLLIEAAGQLRREGWTFKLVLVGDGPMRGTIEQRIAELNLHDTVTIAGWKSNSAVRELMIQSRAMVLASFAEGLPVGIMEALALRRPVISTFVAGIPELVEPGRCGWLVPAGSVEALADALRAALSADAETLDEMGRRGSALVAQRHDARQEAAKLLQRFREGESCEPAHADVTARDFERAHCAK
ncbi:MAG TPA: glycosyltransferase family 4 protein [Pirellulales bacterium]|nr:glycosyltransferase family 4 protein [Pirellulales bacterium]